MIDPLNPENGPNRFFSFTESSDGKVWVGTGANIYLFDPAEGQFIKEFILPSGSPLSSLCFDTQGQLWAGTSNNGLFRLDRKANEFHNYILDPGNPNSLRSNQIHELFLDNQGIVWIGTEAGGLHFFDLQKNQFRHFQPHLSDPNSLNDKVIWSFFEDRKGILWIGTGSGGLNRYDPLSGQFRFFKNDPLDPYSLDDNHIVSIHWKTVEKHCGLPAIILQRFDPATEKFKRYYHDPKDPHSISGPRNLPIFEDRNGILWISAEKGINRYDPQTEHFEHFLPDWRIRYIHQDHQAYLWLGTETAGLIRFDPVKQQHTQFSHDPNDQNSLSYNGIQCIHESRDSTLWVSTRGKGLNRFDRQAETFRRFTEKDGLANSNIYGILEDEKGFLWLSTNKGLDKFDPKTESFFNYDVDDGLQSNEFNSLAYHKSARTGEMYFGGINGFNVFHPDSIRTNDFVPPIVFTAFSYFNKSETEEKPTEVKGITQLKEIVLRYNENMFTCEFAALNYSNPLKNQYAYKLEGENKNWIQLGTKRELTFANLNPGNYTLRVKGSNNDGIWNEEGASLKIAILPPWWQTWWAKASYLVAILLLILSYIRWRTYALRKRQKELEQTVTERTEEIKKNQQQLIQQEKMASLGQMTAGIAHEIKNPLNFVNNLAEVSEELADELKEEIERYQESKDPEDYAIVLEVLAGIQKNAQIIKENGQRADGIVSSMMDHANDNQGERRNTDLNALVEEHLRLAYHGYKGDRQDFEVIFEKKLDASLPPVTINPQEIGRVLINLINNACYAVEEKAKTAGAEYQPTIRVSTQQVNGQVEIRIRDNGPGIPVDIRDKIFNPFFTTKPTGKGSTGLGLSISYDIVVQGHQGSLRCESEPGEGAEFVVGLPVPKI